MIGLFKELEHRNNRFASIIDYRNLMYHGFKEEVITYLRNGITTMVFMESVRDPLSKKDFSIPGGSSLVSDGYWIWREDLAHYVEKYNIGLPDNFINNVLDKIDAEPVSIEEVASKSEKIFDTYNEILLGKSDAFEY